MESTPVSPGVSESSLGKPETSKDKEKKSSEKKSIPLRFGFEVHEKGKDKGVVEFFRRPEKEVTAESKNSPLDVEHKNSAKPDTETEADALLTRRDEQLTAEPELHMPSPEEAWARLQSQEQERALEKPPLAEQEKHVAVVETVLPMELGEIELPLQATEIHERLRFSKAEIENKPEPLAVKANEAAQLPAQETTPLSAEQAAGGSGGGNFEPPSHPEASSNSPEPQPERSSSSALTSEETSPVRHNQADVEHQARIANAVPVSELPSPMASTSETRVIERSSSGALVVGLIDWFGRRRLRKELRRGQKRQDKRIKQLDQRQHKSTEQYRRDHREQSSLNTRLRNQLDTLFQDTTKKRQQFEQQHARILEERRQAQAAEASKRAALLEAREPASRLPADHHLEHSTWHTIEVDKAGRAVEQPTFTYGKEFQHEQHQEARHDDSQVAISSTGQLAVNGTKQSNSTQPASDGLQLPPSLLVEKAHQNFSSRLPAAVQKPWVLVLVIIVFFVVVSAIIVH